MPIGGMSQGQVTVTSGIHLAESVSQELVWKVEVVCIHLNIEYMRGSA